MSAKVPLWCRCGTDKTPIPCVGGCGYLCQLLAAAPATQAKARHTEGPQA